MRFLDCVDRRDAEGAARLLHPDASWSTAGPLGRIDGVANIRALINAGLPARRYGPEFARHRMESSAAVDDLTVITPAGERCRFDIELETLHGNGQSRLAIKNILREIL